MTDDNGLSAVLEFKPVSNFHWIVNKPKTFSLDQMTDDNEDNKFRFIPVQSCQDNWKANINSEFQLDETKIVRCKTTDEANNNAEVDVNPNPVKLIATEVGYGGCIVTLGSASAVVNLLSEYQPLKGVFVVTESRNVVLAYCILPEPINVHNYLQLVYDDPIIEITSTVNTQL
jgi:hypothetical protein